MDWHPLSQLDANVFFGLLHLSPVLLDLLNLIRDSPNRLWTLDFSSCTSSVLWLRYHPRPWVCWSSIPPGGKWDSDCVPQQRGRRACGSSEQGFYPLKIVVGQWHPTWPRVFLYVIDRWPNGRKAWKKRKLVPAQAGLITS
jgi:hypothetical protein